MQSPCSVHAVCNHILVLGDVLDILALPCGDQSQCLVARIFSGHGMVDNHIEIRPRSP